MRDRYRDGDRDRGRDGDMDRDGTGMGTVIGMRDRIGDGVGHSALHQRSPLALFNSCDFNA